MGARAQPDWDRFVVVHQDQYAPDQAAYAPIEVNPLRQIVGARAVRRQSDWSAVRTDGSNRLSRLIAK